MPHPPEFPYNHTKPLGRLVFSKHEPPHRSVLRSAFQPDFHLICFSKEMASRFQTTVKNDFWEKQKPFGKFMFPP